MAKMMMLHSCLVVGARSNALITTSNGVVFAQENYPGDLHRSCLGRLVCY